MSEIIDNNSMQVEENKEAMTSELLETLISIETTESIINNKLKENVENDDEEEEEEEDGNHIIETIIIVIISFDR